MSKEKSLEEMLDEFLESIQNRNNRELTEDKRNKLKNFLEVNFDFVSKDKEEFLNKFNPWQNAEGKKLIQKFENTIKNLDSNKDFSWLEILDGDEQWEEVNNQKTKNEINDKNKHVNMRYQIPTHFHGDIDNAVIFHCMENPRGYLGDWKDNQIDEEFAGVNLEEFYVKSASKRKEESETIKDIIEERYQIQDISYNSITKIIHSYTSPLARELYTMFDRFKDSDYKTYDFSKGSTDLKDYYYLKNYYKQLILGKDNNLEPFKVEENQDKALECANKICNLEIYPFSCAQPSLDKNGIGKKILKNSKLSRLSAYIVLRRIYKYLYKCEQSKTNNKEEPQKPVFIFRKYDRAWKQLFKEVKVEDKFLEYLEDHFFYCQTGQQGGGITSGNVISVRDFRAWKNIYKKLKELAFTEISELLLRVDIDKVDSQKAGD
ncbi:MAG: hypothetical protein E7B64_02035 [Streptococcus mitis]|jgi:hypothetical protein|nr:hypothetical protein [Streptococcus mitis]